MAGGVGTMGRRLRVVRVGGSVGLVAAVLAAWAVREVTSTIARGRIVVGIAARGRRRRSGGRRTSGGAAGLLFTAGRAREEPLLPAAAPRRRGGGGGREGGGGER